MKVNDLGNFVCSVSGCGHESTTESRSDDIIPDVLSDADLLSKAKPTVIEIAAFPKVTSRGVRTREPVSGDMIFVAGSKRATFRQADAVISTELLAFLKDAPRDEECCVLINGARYEITYAGQASASNGESWYTILIEEVE